MAEPTSVSYKRKNEENQMVPSRKARRKFDSNKNPVQLLLELFPGLEFEFQQTGQDHEPCFQVRALIEGSVYEGTGLSKQKSKLDLANLVIEKLNLNQPTCESPSGEEFDISKQEESGKENLLFNIPKAYTFNKNISSNFDWEKFNTYNSSSIFSEDLKLNSNKGEFLFDTSMPGRDRPLYTPPSIRNTSTTQQWPTIKASMTSVGVGNGQMIKKHYPSTHVIGPMLPPEAAQQGYSQLFTNKPIINVEKARCYPVMVLSEIFPDMQINWPEGTGRGDRQFKVEAEVQGRRFFGEGRSKKVAKLNLAKTVLLCMYDIHDFKESDITPKSSLKPKTDDNGSTTNLEKKFPLTQLKEIVGEDLSYEVVQKDQLDEEDEKLFHATVVVKGIAYEAVGKSRNLAKLRAAKKALDVLRPKSNSLEEEDGKKVIDTSRHPTMVFYELYRDVLFVESEAKGSNGLTEYCMEAEVEGRKYSMKASSKKKAKLRLVLTAFEELRDIPMADWTAIDLKDVLEDKQLSSNPAANHPIVLLLKLNPQTRFDVSEDYSCQASSKYKAIAHVGDREFNGEGANKKTAKTCAARQALQNLYGIDPDTYIEDNRTDYFSDAEPKFEVPLELSNRISQVVQDKYAEVFQGETQCKVIAAFVLATTDNEEECSELEVVSIGTGTKCITGDQINHKGETLNDCHGEIIACRGFRQYLFEELSQAINNDPNTILELKHNGKYGIKSNTSVYLFVNTAPCGDGRVFTLQTQQQGAKNKTAGLLRTKIENGQGTIPVPENSIQTTDGILEGERLRTMSCSDKILKWNIIGVQGALLSYFLEPVYMEGIVIGLHYHYDALNRALYKRACKTEDCPEPYRINKPLLGTPNNNDVSRDTSKATSNSFNWYRNQPCVEAVNATTGQTVILTPSRLCKLNFFDKFMTLLKQCKLDTVCDPKTYHSAKLLAKDYQLAKECFFRSLEETTCGKWVGKPYEHDMFGY